MATLDSFGLLGRISLIRWYGHPGMSLCAIRLGLRDGPTTRRGPMVLQLLIYQG
jgi:hypothetical protein